MTQRYVFTAEQDALLSAPFASVKELAARFNMPTSVVSGRRNRLREAQRAAGLLPPKKVYNKSGVRLVEKREPREKRERAAQAQPAPSSPPAAPMPAQPAPVPNAPPTVLPALLRRPPVIQRVCQWLDGDRPDWRKCGDNVQPGKPYCPAHARRAYVQRGEATDA